jgi:hypothetical protein
MIVRKSGTEMGVNKNDTYKYHSPVLLTLIETEVS